MLVTIITFILVFGLLVLVHEYGHYYFAKRAGILVREFSIGMGPKLWWTRKNGTTYTIRLLPLGGYVRLAGKDDDSDDLRPGMAVTLTTDSQGTVTKINASDHQDSLLAGIPLRIVASDLVDQLWISGYENGDESQVKKYPVDHDAVVVERDGTVVRIAPRDVQFQSASLPARMMTNFAGPLNNFLLSLVVFVLLGFTLAGIPTNSNVLGKVAANSPAARAGMVAGDRIVKVDQTRVTNWQELSQAIAPHPGKRLTVTYQHRGHQLQTTVTPRLVRQGQQRTGQIGIAEAEATSFAARLNYGWRQFIGSGALIFTVLGHMVTHGFNLNDLGGPVAIYAGTSQAASLGLNGVLAFLAMLSINLGIVNLIPIPALDGGKLLLNLVEAVTRRPIPEKAEGVLNLLGFAFLLILMVLVTWNDIQRYFIH